MGAGPQERPSGNARPAAARRVCVGWGAGAASMAGAARCPVASGLRAAACLRPPLCCRFPRAALRLREHLPEGVAAGGLLLLAGSAARVSQRSRTLQRAAHPAQKERLSAGAEWCAGGPNDGHPAGARPNGNLLLSEEQPLLTHPHRVAGGVQGGGVPSPVSMVRRNEREGVPTGHTLLLLSNADRLTVGQVWGCPPPPLGKVLYIGHMQHRGESTQGLCPCTPFHGISGARRV